MNWQCLGRGMEQRREAEAEMCLVWKCFIRSREELGTRKRAVVVTGGLGVVPTTERRLLRVPFIALSAFQRSV